VINLSNGNTRICTHGCAPTLAARKRKRGESLTRSISGYFRDFRLGEPELTYRISPSINDDIGIFRRRYPIGGKCFYDIARIRSGKWPRQAGDKFFQDAPERLTKDLASDGRAIFALREIALEFDLEQWRSEGTKLDCSLNGERLYHHQAAGLPRSVRLIGTKARLTPELTFAVSLVSNDGRAGYRAHLFFTKANVLINRSLLQSPAHASGISRAPLRWTSGRVGIADVSNIAEVNHARAQRPLECLIRAVTEPLNVPRAVFIPRLLLARKSAGCTSCDPDTALCKTRIRQSGVNAKVITHRPI